MADPAPKLPPAFALCKDCSCNDVKEQEYREGDPPKPGAKDDRPVVKEVGCTKSDKCAKGGCYCQLFERGKGKKHKDETWAFVRMSHEGYSRQDDKKDYSCFCVEPVLPAGYTLCACGECALGTLGADSARQVKCSGKCPDGAECHLFRLDGQESKWEHEADPEKLVKPESKSYYRCFCVKKG